MNTERPAYIILNRKKFIKGLHGIPDFPEYENTLPDDWYWKEGSVKEENKFLWCPEEDLESIQKNVSQARQ